MWVAGSTSAPHPEQFHSGPKLASPCLSKTEPCNYGATLLKRHEGPNSLEPPTRAASSRISPPPQRLCKPTQFPSDILAALTRWCLGHLLLSGSLIQSGGQQKTLENPDSWTGAKMLSGLPKATQPAVDLNSAWFSAWSGTAVASPAILLVRQNPSPHPRPTKSESAF